MALVPTWKTINDLPSELLLDIFSYIDEESPRYLHLRSKRFRYLDPISRINRRLRSVALVFLWRDVVCRTVDDFMHIIDIVTCDVYNHYHLLDKETLRLKAQSLKETAYHVKYDI